MSPLEKVVFEKNMCLADTSVRGKKWQMALFQVGSFIIFCDYVDLIFYAQKNGARILADVSSIECHRLEIQGLVAPDKMPWRLKGRDKFSTPQKIPDKIQMAKLKHWKA